MAVNNRQRKDVDIRRLIAFHVLTPLTLLQEVAATQRGLFTTRQAAVAGVSAETLQGWRRRRWIRQVRRGVYCFAGVEEHGWHPALAAEVDAQLLGTILDDGVVHRRWTLRQVRDVLDSSGRRRMGVTHLRRLLALRLDDPATNIMLEQRMVRDLAPLAPFEVQYQLLLDGTLVILDAAWPWCRAGAEFDGRSYRQRSRTAHDRESRKLTLLSAHDWKIAHLTASMSPLECLTAVRSLMPAGRQTG